MFSLQHLPALHASSDYIAGNIILTGGHADDHKESDDLVHHFADTLIDICSTI